MQIQSSSQKLDARESYCIDIFGLQTSTKMAPIPKNNLRERLMKLGYDPNSVQITTPVLDNSKVVPDRATTKPTANNQSGSTGTKIEINPVYKPIKKDPNFDPPIILGVDEWSDFEDE